MSRSLHPTLKRFGEVGNTPHKRFLKRVVREERRRLLLAPTAGPARDAAGTPIEQDAASIEIVRPETPPGAQFPVLSSDLRAVLARLPPFALDGLARIEFTMPYVRQETCAVGVLSGPILGLYNSADAVIQLFGFWYESARPDRRIVETYLRLQMLATLVHEVAHHCDFMALVGRGRWVRTSRNDRETFAEAVEYSWTREHVIPYLEETYADEIAELRAWLCEHGGVAVDLAMLAGDPRRNSGETFEQCIFSVREAFFSLIDDVAKGDPKADTRSCFALYLHYHQDYDLALEALARTLADAPDHQPSRHLVADIFVHQGRFAEALLAARELLRDKADHQGAWRVVADAAQGLGDWRVVIEATSLLAGIESRRASDRRADTLTGIHARIELGDFDAAEAAIAGLEAADSPHERDELATLRAHLSLRRGQLEATLELACERLAETKGELPAILGAARFEAAHRLGRPTDAGWLTIEDRSWLGSHGYSAWLAQLDTLGPPPPAPAV